MTLIICDECGKKYSSNAKACPECANPTPDDIEAIKYEEPKVEVKTVKKEKKPVDGVKLSRILIGIGAIIFIVFHFINILINYRFAIFSYLFHGGFTIVLFHFALILACVFNFLGAFHKKDGLLPKIATFLLFFAGFYYLILGVYYFIDEIIGYSKFFGLNYFISFYSVRQLFNIIIYSAIPCILGVASISAIKDYDKYKDKAKLNKMTIIAFISCLIPIVLLVLRIVFFLFGVLLELLGIIDFI